MIVPDLVVEALEKALDDTTRLLELASQIVSEYRNNDPDPASHNDYKLWAQS